jgi:hypothetical protein
MPTTMNHPDKQVHVQVTVGAHGSVTLEELPSQPGQRVDVTISPIVAPTADHAQRYPLSGLKVVYQQPFAGAADGDWGPPHRIPVATVVGMVAEGMTPDEIVRDFPDLEAADVRAALVYAAEAVRERELPLLHAS